MRRALEPVWIIATPLGDAVRCADDVASECDDGIRLRAPISFMPPDIPRAALKTCLYYKDDLPDRTRASTEISNVCGFVAGFSSLFDEHPAWRSVRSTLGCFREAYSLRGGNLLFLRGKLIFKGATSRGGVHATVRRLLSEPDEPILKAYLIIATAYMRRNLMVHNGCLLEEMLSRFAWCRVKTRHEEMSNAVIFYINEWTAAFRLPQGRPAPDMGTVTVSRRGVVNVRLGWHDGVQWDGNDEWIGLVDQVRDFLLTMC